MRKLMVLAVFALLVYLLYAKVWQRPAASERGEAIDVVAEPVQQPLPARQVVEIVRDGTHYRVEQHHRYEISGEVLASASYPLFFSSDFFVVDLGLIWGERREELKQRYSFQQGGRWLFWRSDGPVSDAERRYITAHISNNHLVAAEGRPNLEKAIRWAAPGDFVRIRGFLIDIVGAGDQRVARSSVLRTDQGDGACEVIWVEELQIGDKIYR